MKIRNRLSIQFTLLVASILVVLLSAIFYVSWNQRTSLFYEQLLDRTITTAYIYLEEDEFPPEVYRSVRERYVRTLPEEIGLLYDMSNQPAFVEPPESVPYETAMIDFIRDTATYPDYIAFSEGKWRSVGMFYPDNQGDFVVIVSAIDYTGRAQLANLAWTLIIGYFVAVVILFFAGRFYARQALKPIPHILRQVNAISPSSLDQRLDTGKEGDEISELVGTFNLFLDRLEESFNSQKRFVANASHELRTPLTSIIGELEVALAKQRTGQEYAKVLESVHNDTLVLRDLVSGLLDLAQTDTSRMPGKQELVRIDELVIEAGMLVQKKYPGARVHVNYVTESGNDQDFMFTGNRPLLMNVFVNVIENAVKFSPNLAEAEVIMAADAGNIDVTVKDQGIGIPENEIEKIFDPFFRSRNAIAYKGFGIGLSLVDRILRMMDARIQVDSAPGKGTNARITFGKTPSTVAA